MTNNFIIKNCTKNKNKENAVQELNAMYASFIFDYNEYNNIYDAIQNYYKGDQSK